MIAGFVFCVARFSTRFCCRSVAVNDAPLHVDGSAGRLHCCTTVQGASPRTFYHFLLSESVLFLFLDFRSFQGVSWWQHSCKHNWFFLFGRFSMAMKEDGRQLLCCKPSCFQVHWLSILSLTRALGVVDWYFAICGGLFFVIFFLLNLCIWGQKVRKFLQKKSLLFIQSIFGWSQYASPLVQCLSPRCLQFWCYGAKPRSWRLWLVTELSWKLVVFVIQRFGVSVPLVFFGAYTGECDLCCLSGQNFWMVKYTHLEGEKRTAHLPHWSWVLEW